MSVAARLGLVLLQVSVDLFNFSMYVSTATLELPSAYTNNNNENNENGTLEAWFLIRNAAAHPGVGLCE